MFRMDIEGAWSDDHVAPILFAAAVSDVARELNADAQSDCPPRGKWFDEAIDFREPEGDDITAKVVGLTSEIEKRVRKRNLKAQACHYRRVRKIIANALRCHFHRKPPLVAYSRKADRYDGTPMRRTVDLLQKAELLDTTLGTRGTCSTYQVSPLLVGIALECGVTADSLRMRLPADRLVRQRESGKNSNYVEFATTAESQSWIGDLQAYNGCVAQHDIGIELTAAEEAEWVRNLNHDEHQGDLRYLRPERFRTDLYRSFNHKSFELGGRLYGGWWISVPKALRPKITIDGQPTAELDYSGCAIRMLYHERGIDYRGDPYFLPLVAQYEDKEGFESGYHRNAIKALTQAVVNAEERHDLNKIKLPEGLSFRSRLKRRGLKQGQVVQQIMAEHEPIADSFRSGVGLRLQRRDSDLALAIITALMDKGVVALPIHDSFLVAADKKDMLRLTMCDVYKNSFGFSPEIRD
jgi:hypothetical protein